MTLLKTTITRQLRLAHFYLLFRGGHPLKGTLSLSY